MYREIETQDIELNKTNNKQYIITINQITN